MRIEKKVPRRFSRCPSFEYTDRAVYLHQRLPQFQSHFFPTYIIYFIYMYFLQCSQITTFFITLRIERLQLVQRHSTHFPPQQNQHNIISQLLDFGFPSNFNPTFPPVHLSTCHPYATSCPHCSLQPQVTKLPRKLPNPLPRTGASSAPVWSKTTPSRRNRPLRNGFRRTWIAPMRPHGRMRRPKRLLGRIPSSFPSRDVSFWRIPRLSGSHSNTSTAPSSSSLHTGEQCVHLYMNITIYVLRHAVLNMCVVFICTLPQRG